MLRNIRGTFLIFLLSLIFLIFKNNYSFAGCEGTYGGSGDVTITGNCTSGYASTGDITSLVINNGVEVRWTGAGSRPVGIDHNVAGFVNNGTIRSTGKDRAIHASTGDMHFTNNGDVYTHSNKGGAIKHEGESGDFTLTVINNNGGLIRGGNREAIYTTINNVDIENKAGATISCNGSSCDNTIRLLSQTANATLTNAGTISALGTGAIERRGSTSTTITNSGTIEAGDNAIIVASGTVQTITNTGLISVTSGADIDNNGTITTLENDQGGNDALIYDGAVPTNYNVIVNSASDFGKITFNGTETGTMSFGIKSGSTVGKRTYSGVLQSLAEARLSSKTGTFGSYKWTLEENGSGTWDMVIANARTGYKVRIKKAKLSSIATLLESFNTHGKKSTLTTNLDSLSDAALEKAMKQIKGVTIQKSLGQGIRSNNNFKRAMTGAISAPSFGNMVKNNFANLTNGDIQNYYNPGVLNNVTLTNDFTFGDIAAIYKNRNLLTIGTPESSLYVRTFGGTTNQDKIGDDVGYQNNTAGIIFGNQAAINDLQTGWGVGFSTNGLDYDEGMGLSNTHTLHTNFFMNKDYENFGTSFNFGSFIADNNLTRNVTEGSTQTLKADTTDIGFDMTFGISKNINLGGWIINPSASMNTSYLIQDDIKESGGDLALNIQTDNLLQIKPELGFNLDREFSASELKSRQFNFSLFGSEENKLDGSDSRATIIDTGDGYAMIDDRKKDKFLTAGLGYTSLNNSNNSQLIFNIFTTQNEQNDMNSSLLSFTYNKKF